MTPLEPFDIPLYGAHLIEANAGTGKTYAITTLYLRLLLERRLTVGRILAVTFTNAATAELRRKVRARIADMLAALRGEPSDDDTVRALAAGRHAAGMAAADCAHLTAALYEFDDAAICTIHGFCQRVLQEHAFESGVAFDLELVGDERLLIDELARDFWTRELYDAPPALLRSLGRAAKPEALALLARKAAAIPDLRVLPERPAGDPAAALASGGDPAAALRERTLQLQIDLVAHTRDELRHRKAATDSQSFDDLLQRLDEALHGDGAEALAGKIRDRFPVALIDEFQDTDPVQYRIFERIYRDPAAALFLIGDPKQAIYGFRGADVFAYARARRRLATHLYTLGVNRRSSPSLVRAVNTLFGAAREQFVLPDIPFSASSAAPDARDALGGAAAGRAPLRMLFVRRDGRALSGPAHQMNRAFEGLAWFHAAMAAEITQMLNSKTCIDGDRVQPGDVAVLCGTNLQSAALQAQLSALGVPTVMYGETSVFETCEAEAVERVMRAMADPVDGAAVAAALLTPLLGLSGDQLAAARADDRQWDAWIERFRVWNECWMASGFTVAFRRLLDDRGVPGRILSRPGGERCLTNVLHLAELLHAAAVEGRRGPSALVEWLQRMRADAPAVAAEAAQIRLESDTHALKLTTIHKSKGLQFPVVVCPFLWDGMLLHPAERAAPTFHDPADGDRLSVDLGSAQLDRHRQLAQREALAEKLRLLYVALSRAEQLCIVAWGAFKNCETSALGYLLHQPPTAEATDLIAATSHRICGLSDDGMRAELERVAAGSEGAIEVVELDTDAAPRFQRHTDAGADLVLRSMSRQVQQPWRMASFSALASSEQALPEPAEEGVDQDELAEGPRVMDASAAPPTLREFPRGRRLGNLVHKLFETADFTARDDAGLQANALRWMPQYGVEARWADTLCAALNDVLDTPLTAENPALTLRQVPAARRLNELEFLFPVALQTDETPLGAVSATRLADVFVTHGAPWLADYAARLRRLPFRALAGYMKGFIDLVFAAGERWYLVDYKTNDLGGRCEDYRRPQLLAEMYRHHYVLQYHLYAVALHRYLAQRLRGYAYARHFGGVLYLFVRGMAPAHEPGCGIFFDRPPQDLIEALSDLLARPSGVPGAAQ